MSLCVLEWSGNEEIQDSMKVTAVMAPAIQRTGRGTEQVRLSPSSSDLLRTFGRSCQPFESSMTGAGAASTAQPRYHDQRSLLGSKLNGTFIGATGPQPSWECHVGMQSFLGRSPNGLGEEYCAEIREGMLDVA